MGRPKEESKMRKITTVRPKELNLFNRNFGNLKQYVLDEVEEDAFQAYLKEPTAERLFESNQETKGKFLEAVCKLLDEEYRQQIEDHLQIITMSNDIILKNEYDDMKRKNIKCSRRVKSTMDIIIEEFTSKAFIEYLCEEAIEDNQETYLIKLIVQELTKQNIIGEIYFNSKEEIRNIKLPEAVIELIDEVIKTYPNLKDKSKSIQSSFICKLLITADMLLHCNIIYLYLLSNADTRYLEAVKTIISKLDAWKSQLFFNTIRKKLELNPNDFITSDDILRKLEREFTEEEEQKLGEILENNFITNIAFGILICNDKAITLFYGQEKEMQNIIKNFVVKLSERIKESLLEELEDFNIHDLEKSEVSEEKKNLATAIQIYMIDYKWLQIYVRDDQVKKKSVDVKSWNLYNNITRTVLIRSVPDFYNRQVDKIFKKIIENHRSYSLNDLCEKEFDETSFWGIGISLEVGDITKEQFIEEQQKKGISKELINLFFALTEE